jgi:hypothetical protein
MKKSTVEREGAVTPGSVCIGTLGLLFLVLSLSLLPGPVLVSAMGAAASTIPMHIDKATFRQLSGGTMNDAIFDANSKNGIMTRDKLIELSHMRDCFFSCDIESNDIYGRSIHQRVQAIGAALRAKGLLIWFNEERITKDNIITHVCAGIDRSRSMVCFFTKSYFDRIMSNVPAEHCALEFNYTISKKHPDYIIPVVFEEPLLQQNTWPGSIGLALSQTPCVNFVDDNNFEAKIDDLYKRIVKISKAGENLFKVDNPHTTVLSQTNKPKEEQQFFQWLARSTNIDENKRIIYCTTLIRAGVSNVFTLAKMMHSNPNFLTGIGIAEMDADQIALAVRDLGLGYVPVKEFNKSLNIETVVYAIRKASQQEDDPTFAENALSCAARIAASNKIMPSIMHEAGIGEAVLRLIQKFLGHANSMEYGCLTLYNMSIGNIDVSEKLGSMNACDVIPRVVRSHPEHLGVIHNACLAIASLAENKDNRHRFTFTGACDVIIKVGKAAIANPDVMEKIYLAGNRLGDHHQDNVSKLGNAGACEAIIHGLATYPQHTSLVYQAFQFMIILSTEPSNRTTLGGQEPASQAFVRALNSQLEHIPTVIMGCNAVADVIMGNAFNRTNYSKVGCCEVIRNIILKYAMDLNVLAAASRSIFALAAGALENKPKFQGVGNILNQALQKNPALPEPVKNDMRAAISKI